MALTCKYFAIAPLNVELTETMCQLSFFGIFFILSYLMTMSIAWIVSVGGVCGYFPKRQIGFSLVKHVVSHDNIIPAMFLSVESFQEHRSLFYLITHPRKKSQSNWLIKHWALNLVHYRQMPTLFCLRSDKLKQFIRFHGISMASWFLLLHGLS